MVLAVAVVSHGHEEMIINNASFYNNLRDLGCFVCFRDNIRSTSLKSFSEGQGFFYSASTRPIGFGENNNSVFKEVESAFGLRASDYFCVINPDVYFDPEILKGVVQEMERYGKTIATVNLFRDDKFSEPDYNIKRFPTLVDFACGFVGGRNPAAYNKDLLSNPCNVDWASGAFLMFRADLYAALGGFDERYFMYLEDVDICRRARAEFGESVLYLPQFRAVHLCQQANKRILSRHFFWFIRSMIQYFWRHRGKIMPPLRVH